MKKPVVKLSLTILVAISISACTQEAQNKFGRAMQNWTGTNGVLEIYAGERLVKRFMKQFFRVYRYLPTLFVYVDSGINIMTSKI